jgi:DNA-binding NtrC family response regulator
MQRTFTILVVEENAIVRRRTKRLLEKEGVEVLVASDAPAALAVLAKPEKQVDLVIIGTVGNLGAGQLDSAGSTLAKAPQVAPEGQEGKDKVQSE